MLALYLHIPFCLSKCRYCAFNSRALPPGSARSPEGGALIRDYLAALSRELHLAACARRRASGRDVPGVNARPYDHYDIDRLSNMEPCQKKHIITSTSVPRPEGARRLRSIYFGGGTPTILDPSCLCSLLEQSRRYFRWDESIEITVEANPATVDRAGLAELRRAGVNRLSLGAQSFNAAELQLLGRVHDAADIHAACRDARAAGFDNISLDLIYGLPGQTVGAWRENLQRALDLDPEHLSAYGLKLEPGTPLAEDLAAGRLKECGEEEQVAMWYETQRLTSAAGLERYEISNYARPGRQSRHNLAYWHNEPCLALGAGASGYVPAMRAQESGVRGQETGDRGRDWRRQSLQESDTRPLTPDPCFVRYTNHQAVDHYIAAVARGELPRAWEEHQTPEQERADTVMMGLRLTAGLDRPAFEARFGHPFEFFYGEQLAIMERDGLMARSDTAVYLTERGLLLSNYVLARFI